MSFIRFSLVLIGIILVLFSYAAQAQSCSDMSIYADDTIMNENDTESDYIVTLENDSDDTFIIENVQVTDNSSYLTATYSGWEDSYVDSWSFTDLYIDMESFSVDSDREATVTVKAKGHFEGGDDCSYSEIQQTFIVEIQDSDDGSSTGDCSDIGIQTYNFHVPESSTTYKIFTVSNSSNDDFIIEDVQVRDNSSYFSLDRTYESNVYADSDIDLRIIVNSNSVSSQQQGRGYVKLRGYFQDGGSCSFDDIGEQGFDVTIDNSGEGSCGYISLDTETVSVNEDDTEYNYFSITNDSGNSFTVEDVQIEENSSYYSQSVVNFDETIPSKSDGEVRIKTVANSVAGNKTATSTLKVRGHFSNGDDCSFSDLSRTFLTEVKDDESNDDEDNGGTSSGDCSDLDIETHTVEVNANDSVTDSFFLSNSAARNFYIDDIVVKDSSDLFNSNKLDFDNVAPRDGEAALNFTVRAYGANNNATGTATIQVKGHFSDGKTCSYSSIGTKSFTVHVNAVSQQPQPTPAPTPAAGKAIEITDYPGRVNVPGNTFIAVTVKNNSYFAKNITFGFSGFPEGLMLETNTYNVAGQSAKTVYLDIDARGKTGTFTGTVYIQSESAKDEKQITLVASAGEGTQTQDIDMQTQISRSNGTYDLTVKIKNNLSRAVSGTVSVDLPSGWKISGITSISLYPGEEKTTILNIVPSAQPSNEIISSARFMTDEGLQVKKTISFQPNAGIAGTALVLLSQAAVWIGLIIIAAIIVLFIAEKIRG